MELQMWIEAPQKTHATLMRTPNCFEGVFKSQPNHAPQQTRYVTLCWIIATATAAQQ